MYGEDEHNNKLCNGQREHNLNSDFCNNQSSSESTADFLALSLKHSDSDEHDNKCKQCNTSFKDFISKLNHRCLPFTCKLCNSAFSYDYQLSLHKCDMKTSDKNIYKCVSSPSKQSLSDGVVNSSQIRRNAFDTRSVYSNGVDQETFTHISYDNSPSSTNLPMKRNRVDVSEKTLRKNSSKKLKTKIHDMFSEYHEYSATKNTHHIHAHESQCSYAKSKKEVSDTSKFSNTGSISKRLGNVCDSTKSSNSTALSDHVLIYVNYKDKLHGDSRHPRRFKRSNKSVSSSSTKSSPSHSENSSLGCDSTVEATGIPNNWNELNMHAEIDNSDISNDCGQGPINLSTEVGITDEDYRKEKRSNEVENQFHRIETESSKCITSSDISYSNVHESTNWTAKKKKKHAKHSRKWDLEPCNVEPESSNCTISKDISNDCVLESAKNRVDVDDRYSMNNIKGLAGVASRSVAECSDSSSSEHNNLSTQLNLVSKKKNNVPNKKSNSDLSGRKFLSLDRKGTYINESSKYLESDDSEKLSREIHKNNVSISNFENKKGTEEQLTSPGTHNFKKRVLDSKDTKFKNKFSKKLNSSVETSEIHPPSFENKKGSEKQLTSPGTDNLKKRVLDSRDTKFKKKFSTKQNSSIETSEIHPPSLLQGTPECHSSEKRKRSITPDSKKGEEEVQAVNMLITFAKNSSNKRQIYVTKITPDGTSEENSASASKVLSSTPNKGSMGKKHKTGDITSNSVRSRGSTDKITEKSKNVLDLNNSKSCANSVLDNRSNHLVYTNRQLGENEKRISTNFHTVENLFKSLPNNGTVVIKLSTSGCTSYKCLKCGHIFKHLNKATDHSHVCQNQKLKEKLPTQPVDFAYVCTLCYQCWASPYELDKHNCCRPVLNSSEKLSNSGQTSNNVSISDYIYHYENINKNFICPKCSYSCLSLYTFNQHQCDRRLELMKKCYVGVTKLSENDLTELCDLSRFQCPTCQSVFYDNTTFQNHTKSHVDARLNVAKSCVDSGKACVAKEIRKIMKNTKDCNSSLDVVTKLLGPISEIVACIDPENTMFPDLNVDVPVPYDQLKLITDTAKQILSKETEGGSVNLVGDFSLDNVFKSDDSESKDSTSSDNSVSTELNYIHCSCKKKAEENPGVETKEIGKNSGVETKEIGESPVEERKPCFKCLNLYLSEYIEKIEVPRSCDVQNKESTSGSFVSSTDFGTTVPYSDSGAAASCSDSGAAASCSDSGAAASCSDSGAAASCSDSGAAASCSDSGAVASCSDSGAAEQASNSHSATPKNYPVLISPVSQDLVCPVPANVPDLNEGALNNSILSSVSCSVENVKSDVKTTDLSEMTSNSSLNASDFVNIFCYVPKVSDSEINQKLLYSTRLFSDIEPTYWSHYRLFPVEFDCILSLLSDIRLHFKVTNIILFMEIEFSNSKIDEDREKSFVDTALCMSHPVILIPTLTELYTETYKKKKIPVAGFPEEGPSFLSLNETQTQQLSPVPKCMCYWKFEELMDFLLRQEENNNFSVLFSVYSSVSVKVSVHWHFNSAVYYSVYILKSPEQRYVCGICFEEYSVSLILEHLHTEHNETSITMLIP